MKINKSDCGNDEKCCKSSLQAFVCTQRDAHILLFCGTTWKSRGYIQSAAREKWTFEMPWPTLVTYG